MHTIGLKGESCNLKVCCYAYLLQLPLCCSENEECDDGDDDDEMVLLSLMNIILSWNTFTNFVKHL